MNRIERRIRNMINPYSTAFAWWWCHSGRYTRLGRRISGTTATAPPREGRVRPGARGGTAGAFGRRVPGPVMAARRAAVDALLASHDEKHTAGP